jgi:iron complex outermembrane receptor protein
MRHSSQNTSENNDNLRSIRYFLGREKLTRGTRKYSLLICSAIGALAATGAASVAQAQEAASTVGIEDIVVTAQKRGENIQKVPIAISALSSQALASQGITSIQGVVNATPSLYQAPYPTNNTALFLFMRGMGVGDPMQVTKDSSIGIYQNGIYNARPQALAFDLADVERVEVLRGPQGTLYGRNTTGGAINIISRAPSGEAGIRQLLSYGMRNQYRSVTNIDLPEFANISLKGTLALGGDDGWSKNRSDPNVPNTNDFNTESHVAGRIAARWRPSDDFTADYSFEIGKVKSTPILLESPALNGLTLYPGVVYQARRDRAYRAAELPESETRIRDHGLTLDWRASDALTIRSITGIRYYDSYTFSDTLEVFLLPLVSENELLSKQFSQEFQFIGKMGNRIKYAAGLYYFREKADHLTQNTFFITSQQQNFVNARSESQAAYAQLTYTPPVVDDKIDLTVGGRYTIDKRRATRNSFFNGFQTEANVSNRQKFKRFTPSFTANVDWTNDVSTYAKVATGYRSGGSGESGADFTQTFAPETLISYELGFKSVLLDRHLRFNVAAFYNKYDKMQLDITTDPNNVAISETRNAGKADIKGVEVDITAAVTPELSLSLSYAYLHTKVKNVSLDSGPNIANLFVIPYAPRNSINLGFDWTLARLDAGNVILHGDYSYKSKVFGTAGAGPAVIGREFYATAGYSNVNGRITLQREMFGRPVDFSFWAKNILNDRYSVYGAGPGAQLTGYTSAAFAYNAPRSVGIEISLR